jgi:hypothetical protein
MFEALLNLLLQQIDMLFLGARSTSQRETDLFLARIYHEAPNDVFELIVSLCSEDRRSVLEYGLWKSGGLNPFRLTNKRCKRVVDSCTNQLSNRQKGDGPDLLPIPIIQSCRRIETIILGHSCSLKSLEGCPFQLKMLDVGFAPYLSDLSPLASCSKMEKLQMRDSSVTDISVVASMPLLQEFNCQKPWLGRRRLTSVRKLSPLLSCPMLRVLRLDGNIELKDLCSLSGCTSLELLNINGCPLINNLAPLSALAKLKELSCREIDPQTSVLPLASCVGLERFYCTLDAVDLDKLKRRRPDLRFDIDLNTFL